MVHSSFESYPGLLIWHSKDLVNRTPAASALADEKGNRYLYFANGGYVPLSEDGLSVVGDMKPAYSGGPYGALNATLLIY